jgi:hypothetical protein
MRERERERERERDFYVVGVSCSEFGRTLFLNGIC